LADRSSTNGPFASCHLTFVSIVETRCTEAHYPTLGAGPGCPGPPAWILTEEARPEKRNHVSNGDHQSEDKEDADGDASDCEAAHLLTNATEFARRSRRMDSNWPLKYRRVRPPARWQQRL
jgi:hypothetical protein